MSNEITAPVTIIRNEITAPVRHGGRDAYQLAVADGFVGTREEWLATLQAPSMGALPSYADDSAADDDSTLPIGSLYLIVGGRAVYQKP